MVGRFHSPQPDAASHLGLAILGASHDPSSSSSQSSGIFASGSLTYSGSSSSQSSGFSASASSISRGASSSQSSGFVASTSRISFSSTQSSGLWSVGSSMVSGGLTGGSKSLRRLPLRTESWSMKISNELSFFTTRVYRCDSLSLLIEGGFFRCFSSTTPVFGFLWRKMKWTLLVTPHLSGPNMMVYGVLSWKSSTFSLLAVRSFM
mmetsp:Transcript_16185/g.27949  ORF Transcript_16185/g.27949 Transcript_16185/m.27949 type:complete len:206 (+) Transcript_16185:1744-2361(+)